LGIFGGSIESLLNDISFVLNYSAYWDGLNNFRETVSARTGIQNIQTGDFKDIKKIVLLKLILGLLFLVHSQIEF